MPQDVETVPSEDLVFDGERFVPGAGVGIAYEHWSRYAFAAALAEGRDVLEVGCGEGYGSSFLARTARTVHAFDASASAVAHAQGKYGAAANLRYEQATIQSFFASAAPATADVVVAFEVIEHVSVEDQEVLLDGIKRVLRPGGSALVSTPDKLLYTDRPLAKNPFHVREFYREEFVAELTKRFKEIRIYDQALLTGCAIVAPRARTLAAHQMSWLDLLRAKGICEPGVHASGEYLVALVSDGPLPELSSLLLADFSRKLMAEGLQAERRTADRLARELEEARRAWEAATAGEAKAREEASAMRQEAAAARHELVAGTQAALRERDARIAQLRKELALAKNILRTARIESGRGLEPRARELAGILRAVPRKSWLRPPSAAKTVRALFRRRHESRALDASGLFDRAFYLAQNGDVAASGVDPLEHYLQFGAAEGRDPNPFFDTSFYLSQNPDIAKSGVNPLLHYAEHGWRERRNPHRAFDTAFYIDANPDVAREGLNPLAHFLAHGQAEGRAPSRQYREPNGTSSSSPAPTEALRAWRSAMDRTPWRALVIDSVLPMPDRDSGSITTLELMRALQSLGYAVTVAPADMARIEPYATALEDAGFWCATERESDSLQAFLSEDGARFDVIVPCRIPVACHLRETLDAHAPDATVVFETMDLHFLREEREAMLSGSPEALDRARKTRELELAFIRRADATIVHSSVEREVLQREVPDASVFEMPYVIEARPGHGADQDRRDVVFLGGFRHRPNVDAVQFFAREIWPLVRRRLPEARFVIVGSDPPIEVRDLAGPDIVVTGYVEQLGPVFDAARLSVAPLRYGAGYKGKVAMSMAHGVPGVLSSVAAEGMGLTHECEVLIADDPAAFAEQVVRLHGDSELWTRLSNAGLRAVRERFSPAAARLKLESILRTAGAPLWEADWRAGVPPPRPGQPMPGRAVFPSRFMRDLHALAGVRVADAVLVPHGVDFHHGADARRADRTSLVVPGRLRLLFAGRITHFKGLHTAIEALPIVQRLVPWLHLELAIVGDGTDGSYVERVRKMVEERKLVDRVSILPPVGEDALFELFQQHDIYLFPSLFEPFALTLILALEAGIPAVATATGGNVDLVVDHDTGLLYPPGDAAAMAECIAELACNAPLRASVSAAGRTAASQLTVDAMITRLEHCLDDTAVRAGPPAREAS